MGLTDDPMYRKMIEGYDTRLLVGTMGVPANGRTIVFPLFMVDYHDAAEDMDKLVAETIDEAKKINLRVKNGTYSVDLDERGTVMLFAEGEQAVHTAPNFWAEYTPDAEDHKAFQEEYAKTRAWMFMLVTKKFLREILVSPEGDVLFRRTVPLTDELRKMLGLKT